MAAADQLSLAERVALGQALAGALATVAPQAGVVASGAQVATFTAMVLAPDFPARSSIGFVEGFVLGFLDGAKLWLNDLSALARLVGVGTTVGLAEFFARPLFESDPAGLMPQTRRALENLNTVKRLKPVFQWLSAVGPEEAVRTLRELIPTAEDIAAIVGRAVGEWFAKLVALAPDSTAVGEQVGRLVGRVVLEIIRCDVEPMSFAFIEPLEADDPEAAAWQ